MPAADTAELAYVVAQLRVAHQCADMLDIRVGAEGELAAVIVHAFQIAQPAGQYQRNVNQPGGTVCGQHGVIVSVQRGAEARRNLTRGIGCGTLRGILQERVRITFAENLVQECLRVDNARVATIGIASCSLRRVMRLTSSVSFISSLMRV